MRVLVLGRAAWQTAGGGSGGKLQSWETRCSADGRIKDRRLGGGVKDEGISPDDVGRRGAGIGTGLRSDRGAGMATGGEGPEELCMSGPGLLLAPPPEITAAGDEDAEDSHGQDRGDAR